jgi:hypothetical protein
MDGSNSFRTMMWCWPESRGGMRGPGASCPRWRPKAAAVALVGNKASVEIGEDQWVVEHEQDTGKWRCQRRKKADGSQKDSFVIPKNSKDSSVN